MKLDFSYSLPILKDIDQVADVIKNNQVTIICGETGSGKTTQLPKICLDLGRGQKKNNWAYPAKKNRSPLGCIKDCGRA